VPFDRQLRRAENASQVPLSGLRQALGRDFNGKISPVRYLSGIALAFISPWLAMLVFTGAAIMWIAPDKRVERNLAERETSSA